MRIRRLLAALAIAALIAPIASVEAGAPQIQDDEVRYIVHLRQDVVDAEVGRFRGQDADRVRGRAVAALAGELPIRYRVARGDVFTRAFSGAIVTASAAECAALMSDPRVVLVEREQATEVLPVPTTAVDPDVQRNAMNWGLDRIDQRDGLDQKFETEFDGTGVDVYIIDTGAFGRHRDFKGRMSRGRDFTKNGNAPGNKDCQSHGTHVSSIAAGRQWGVAPGAQVVPLKVFPKCSGQGSSIEVVEAMEWILKNHDPKRGGVANLSLGFTGDSPSTRAGIKALYQAGIVTAAAAGNDKKDTCNRSPGNSMFGITTGASDHKKAFDSPGGSMIEAGRDDKAAGFSNHGPCVDIFAPGTVIKAAGIQNRNATSYKSGTSMASPFVAGAVALLMQRRPDWSPEQIRDEIEKYGTKKAMKGLRKNTVNLLLYAVPEEYKGR
ncbi:MAG: S8 family serine peptidase [Acidobacteria bacterium]|nr:S8 family serine peptidase [Acidobacteriota bacterium]